MTEHTRRTAADRVVGSYAKISRAEYPASYTGTKIAPRPTQIGQVVLIRHLSTIQGLEIAGIQFANGTVGYVDALHLNPQCPQCFPIEGQDAGRWEAEEIGPTALHVAVAERLPHERNDATTSSVCGRRCRVVHSDDSLRLVWVINPLTNQVCRVHYEDLLSGSLADVTRRYVESGTVWRLKQELHNQRKRAVAAESERDQLKKEANLRRDLEMVIRPERSTGKPEWILWNPSSKLPPRVKYDTEQQAKQVARTMAERVPGETFHICKLEGGAKVERVATQRVVTEYANQLKEF